MYGERSITTLDALLDKEFNMNLCSMLWDIAIGISDERLRFFLMALRAMIKVLKKLITPITSIDGNSPDISTAPS